MKLLSPYREVEYADSISGRAFRATPFWVSANGKTAYAIPGFERPIKGRGWKSFDHSSRYWRLFNFGPVDPEFIANWLIPNAPPFSIHTLHDSVTRVKVWYCLFVW